jgi:MoaA/NifB/PqqE/SkfB family radical SAM enzyme
MCNIWENPSQPDNEITPDIAAKLPSGLGRINLTGGEPFLRDDVGEFVKILRKKAKLVEISTNGYYTEKIIDIAQKFPKDVMFRISIEGLPHLNDKLRGLKNGFDHALRTVLELRKTGVKDYGFSIVICDKNALDLLAVYDLCSQLGVEFGNSTMHNSWYFHKHDNRISDVKLAAKVEREFIRALLQSRRDSYGMRIKDWLRAYFNLNILKYLEGRGNIMTSCTAGSDLFFLDPYGNILPCNGSENPWIMGNLKERNWNEIWNGPQAQMIREKVAWCDRSCAFIGTARFDMRRHPWRPLSWIVINKLRLAIGRDIIYY